jgi:hypothetical protein
LALKLGSFAPELLFSLLCTRNYRADSKTVTIAHTGSRYPATAVVEDPRRTNSVRQWVEDDTCTHVCLSAPVGIAWESLRWQNNEKDSVTRQYLKFLH